MTDEQVEKLVEALNRIGVWLVCIGIILIAMMFVLVLK